MKQKWNDWAGQEWPGWMMILLPAVLGFVQLELCAGNNWGMSFINIVLNIGILVCFYGVLVAVSNHFVAGILLGNIIVTVLSIGNHYVTEFRGSPLSTKDIKNFGTAMAVVESYQFLPSKRVIITVGIFLMILVFAIFFGAWKKTTIRKSIKGYLVQAGIVLAATAGYLYVGFFAPWSIKPKNTFGWSWEMAYHEYGFLAESLEIMEASWTMVKKPEGYSQEKKQEILDAIDTEAPVSDPLPNIIMILNESWYDLELLVELDYEGEITPNIDRTENAIHGSCVVPSIGTNLSEYEFLTGDSLQLMQGITPFNSLNMANHESIVTVLESLGYRTTAMHPAISTNYSRNVAYPAMGFDESLFVDDFLSYEIYGERPHTTDSAAYETLINCYEEHQGDGPQLLYLLTIQNHGSWDVNPDEYDTVEITNEYSPYKDPAEEYLSCLQLTDQAWKELTDYYSQVEEPTIICMVGDHRPAVADNLAKYWTYRTEEELALLMNITPYVIWSNYDVDWNAVEDVETTSINYIPSVLLDLAGIHVDAYYNYMSELRKEIPILSSLNMYIAANGQEHSYVEENQYQEKIWKYHIMEYGRMIGERSGGRLQNDHFQQLNELVTKRDYEELWKYLVKYDLFERPYQEYGDLYFATYALEYAEKCRNRLEQNALTENELGWYVSEIAQGIYDIDLCLAEMEYEHGTDVVMQEIRRELITVLCDGLGMTAQELDQALALCKELETDEDYEGRIARFADIGRTAAQRQGLAILE